jgi:hypothetical protein
MIVRCRSHGPSLAVCGPPVWSASLSSKTLEIRTALPSQPPPSINHTYRHISTHLTSCPCPIDSSIPSFPIYALLTSLYPTISLFAPFHCALGLFVSGSRRWSKRVAPSEAALVRLRNPFWWLGYFDKYYSSFLCFRCLQTLREYASLIVPLLLMHICILKSNTITQ